VFTDAVTKGLDKNVPMKESGVDWIGLALYLSGIHYLNPEDITEDIVIIKINKSYSTTLSSLQLYDVTRGCWKRKIESVSVAEYALAVSFGTVVEVYRIDRWCTADKLNRETIPYDPEIEKGRIGFFGSVAETSVRNKYIGKSMKKFFKRGEADPVKVIRAV